MTLNDFLDGYSNPKTRESYESNLGRFLAWCASKGQEPSEALGNAWVTETYVNMGSRNTAVAAIRSYLRFLGKPNNVKIEPYRAPRQPVVDWDRERARVYSESLSPRDKALLAVFFDVGCRWVGAENMTWANVRFDSLEIDTVEKRNIRRTRDSKMGAYRMSKACAGALQAWREAQDPPSPKVFPFTYRTSLRIVQAFLSRQGTEVRPPREGGHAIRRGYGTMQRHKAKDSGVDPLKSLDLIRRSLSHTNLQTTMEYLYMDREEEQDWYDRVVGGVSDVADEAEPEAGVEGAEGAHPVEAERAAARGEGDASEAHRGSGGGGADDVLRRRGQGRRP